MPSQPRTISRSNSSLVSRSMPSRRWPYGPAHEQPPRAWIPNRSLSSVTTKLWWRYAVRWRTTNDTIDSRNAWRLPRIVRLGWVDQLALADRVGADRFLELEHQAGADRLDDRRRAALLAMHRIGEVAVLGLVDVRHRAAAGTRRYGVAQQVALGDQHARGARTADELVRRDEHRVLLGTVAAVSAVHLDRDVRPGGRVVPERVRAVAVQQRRDRAGVARDPGDVRRRREAADLERPAGVAHQLALEVLEIDVAVGV